MDTMAEIEKVINQIRNILRNEGLTGMDSINHCVIFILARWLNEKRCRKFNIPAKYAFENIQKDDEGEQLGEQEFYAKIYNIERITKKDGTDTGICENCLIYYIVNSLKFTGIKFKVNGPHNLIEIFDI